MLPDLGLMPDFAGRKLLLFVLTTPVQFMAGWQFYRRSWGALKHRTATMDVLIAMGTSAAYFYSVATTFCPRGSRLLRHRRGDHHPHPPGQVPGGPAPRAGPPRPSSG